LCTTVEGILGYQWERGKWQEGFFLPERVVILFFQSGATRHGLLGGGVPALFSGCSFGLLPDAADIFSSRSAERRVFT
jgi:hypothetical protein